MILNDIVLFCVQVIDWICDYGEVYLDSYKIVGFNQQEIEILLKEYYEFRIRVKVFQFLYYYIVYFYSIVICRIVFIKVFVLFIL